MSGRTVRLFVTIFAAGCVLGASPLASGATMFTIYVSDITNDRTQAYTSDPTPVWNSTGGSLANPQGITFGPDGLLYVASQDANRIARFNPATGAFVDNFATGINVPTGLVFGPDTSGDGKADLYVTTWNQNSAVRVEWTPSGPGGTSVFTSGAGSSLSHSSGIIFGADGNLYVSGYSSNNVVRFNGSTGAFIDVFASGITGAAAMTFDAAGDLYVASFTGDKVLKFQGPSGASPGALIGDFISAGLNSPTGIAFGPDGLFYVASSGVSTNGKILRYEADGTFYDEFLNGTNGVYRPTYFTFSVVPEPGTMTLLASGLGLLAVLVVRRRRRQ